MNWLVWTLETEGGCRLPLPVTRQYYRLLSLNTLRVIGCCRTERIYMDQDEIEAGNGLR